MKLLASVTPKVICVLCPDLASQHSPEVTAGRGRHRRRSSWALGRQAGAWAGCTVRGTVPTPLRRRTLSHLVAGTLQRAEASGSEQHQWAQSPDTLLLGTMPSYFIWSCSDRENSRPSGENRKRGLPML